MTMLKEDFCSTIDEFLQVGNLVRRYKNEDVRLLTQGESRSTNPNSNLNSNSNPNPNPNLYSLKVRVVV